MLAVVLAGCLAGVIVLYADPHGFASLRDTTGASGASAVSGRSGASHSSGTGRSSGTTSPAALPPPPSTPTTGSGPSSKGAPVISALSPASGRGGQKVSISGSDFLSADGTITAYFGTQPAPTACPSATQCSTTAPAGLSGEVMVRIHTEGGISNAKPFSYLTR